jgi:hypothetical protein
MRHRAAFWLLALLALLAASGCGQRREVLNPETAQSPGFPMPTRSIELGARVLLDLADGSRVDGEVLALAADSVALRAVPDPATAANRWQRGAQPSDRRTVPLSAIRGGWRQALGQSQPILVLKTRAGRRELRVAELWRGDRLHWQTRDGATGAGYLAALTADSLVLDARSPFARGDEPQESRMALVALSSLRCEDRQVERELGAAVSVPLVLATLGVILLAVALSTSPIF